MKTNKKTKPQKNNSGSHLLRLKAKIIIVLENAGRKKRKIKGNTFATCIRMHEETHAEKKHLRLPADGGGWKEKEKKVD